MIGSGFVRTMSRYNRWQNESLYSAADGLDEAARRLHRGAFFGSIHGTLSHLYWGDNMWMSRFTDVPKPAVGIPGSATFMEDWPALKAARVQFDARIIAWADSLDDAALAGDLNWYSGAAKKDMTKPLWIAVTHFFNHQTHHRGQVHAMLTAAGAAPDATDFIRMQAH